MEGGRVRRRKRRRQGGAYWRGRGPVAQERSHREGGWSSSHSDIDGENQREKRRSGGQWMKKRKGEEEEVWRRKERRRCGEEWRHQKIDHESIVRSGKVEESKRSGLRTLGDSDEEAEGEQRREKVWRRRAENCSRGGSQGHWVHHQRVSEGREEMEEEKEENGLGNDLPSQTSLPLPPPQ
jgi:hypothetical protein